MERLFTVRCESNIFDVDVKKMKNGRFFAEGFTADTFDEIIKKLQSEYGSIKVIDKPVTEAGSFDRIDPRR